MTHTANIDLDIKITKEEMAASIQSVPENSDFDPLAIMNQMFEELKDNG